MNTNQALLNVLTLSLIGLASACTSMSPTQKAALFGSPAPVPTASRSITLTPGMKYVNVDSGETVAFKTDSQTVAWTFLEALQDTSVQMSVIFPDVSEARGIRVYIERSKFLSGG